MSDKTLKEIHEAASRISSVLLVAKNLMNVVATIHSNVVRIGNGINENEQLRVRQTQALRKDIAEIKKLLTAQQPEPSTAVPSRSADVGEADRTQQPTE